MTWTPVQPPNVAEWGNAGLLSVLLETGGVLLLESGERMLVEASDAEDVWVGVNPSPGSSWAQIET